MPGRTSPVAGPTVELGLTSMANQSLAQSEFARRHFKRNFFFGVSNGVLFNFAWAFIGTSTVLPLFISRLTSSQLLIGLASTLESLGWFLPQVAIAAITLHRTNQKPIYMRAAVLRAISFVLFAILVLVLGNRHPSYLLWTFFFLFSLYSFGGGLGGVSFMDMVGKSIPADKRGSFFGMRMLIGGGLSALAGILIERILNAYDFPHNFGLLFLIASVLIILALASVAMMKEPVASVKPQRKTVRENLLLGFSIAGADRTYRMLLWVRVAIGCYVMGLPFYIIYASKFLHVPSSMAGLFLSVQMAGFLSSNLLWAYLSNRSKNRLVLVYCAIFSSACPALVLCSVFFGIPLWMYGAVFFFLGATISGLDMGYLNYLLEIAPEEKRPIYLGFLNTVVGPTIFLSALGGLIIQISSFAFLYALLFALSLVAVLLSLSLKNMREGVPAE